MNKIIITLISLMMIGGSIPLAKEGYDRFKKLDGGEENNTTDRPLYIVANIQINWSFEFSNNDTFFRILWILDGAEIYDDESPSTKLNSSAHWEIPWPNSDTMLIEYEIETNSSFSENNVTITYLEYGEFTQDNPGGTLKFQVYQM